MAVIDSYFWGFSKKIIDIATANKKNIKHIKLSWFWPGQDWLWPAGDRDPIQQGAR